jgi:hypothetical protein
LNQNVSLVCFISVLFAVFLEVLFAVFAVFWSKTPNLRRSGYGTLLSQLGVSSNPIHVCFLLLPTFRFSGACYTGLIWLVSIVWGVGQAHIDHGEESELVTTSLPDTPGSSRVLSRSALDHGEF